MFGKPPDEVPEGLTAQEYLDLALWYEEHSLFPQARHSLAQALRMEPEGPIAVRAKRLMATRLPAIDLPKEAIDRFRQLEGEVMIKPHYAARKARDLIDDYPSFSWPHRVIARVQLHSGDPDGALETLRKALELHPDWIPGLRMLAHAHIVNMDYDEAKNVLEKAMSITPDDEELRSLRRSLEYIRALDHDIPSVMKF